MPDGKPCHICKRPLNEEGEMYCSAAHPRKCLDCGLYPDHGGQCTGGCQCKSGALRALTDLYNEVDRLPVRHRANLMASIALLAGEITGLRVQQPLPRKVWIRGWAGGITVRAEKPKEGVGTPSTRTMPDDGIWFQIEVK